MKLSIIVPVIMPTVSVLPSSFFRQKLSAYKCFGSMRAVLMYCLDLTNCRACRRVLGENWLGVYDGLTKGRQVVLDFPLLKLSTHVSKGGTCRLCGALKRPNLTKSSGTQHDKSVRG
jgi:hypothetical protein